MPALEGEAMTLSRRAFLTGLGASSVVVATPPIVEWLTRRKWWDMGAAWRKQDVSGYDIRFVQGDYVWEIYRSNGDDAVPVGRIVSIENGVITLDRPLDESSPLDVWLYCADKP